jgi:hypothetical protein
MEFSTAVSGVSRHARRTQPGTVATGGGRGYPLRVYSTLSERFHS